MIEPVKKFTWWVLTDPKYRRGAHYFNIDGGLFYNSINLLENVEEFNRFKTRKLALEYRARKGLPTFLKPTKIELLLHIGAAK